MIWKHLIGFCCVLFVVILWNGSSQMIQFIFKDISFKKPLFLTYFSTCLFQFYFLGFFIFKSWREEIKTGKIYDTILNGFMICPLWFTANISYNYSLSLTSVSSNTILSSTSNLFTFLLCFLLKIDSFSMIRLSSILISISGIILIIYNNSIQNDTLLGNILSIYGAFFYGMYTTFVKKRVEEDSPSKILLLFAFIGFFNMILMSPLFLIVHFSHLELFEFPNLKTLSFLFLNGIFGTVLSDIFWSFGVMLTSPIICTLGLSLSIPLSIFLDWIIRNTVFNIQYFFGSFLILLGFIFVNLSYYLPNDLNYFDQLKFLNKFLNIF